MKEETLRWVERAERDLDDAETLLQSESYASAGFFAQQAAEKALKSVLIERQASFPRIHDLKVLAREAKAPEELVARMRPLTTAYMAFRYPDVEENVTPSEARGLVLWRRRWWGGPAARSDV